MEDAVPSPLASSVEKRNRAKLIRLLTEGGAMALREIFDRIFDRIYPLTNLRDKLKANYDILRNLLSRKVLSRHRWNLLFAPGEAGPDSKTFDISLLFLLLTNTCELSPPPSGWHTEPVSSDTSLEANLARVKYFHDMLLGHVSTSGVKTPTFNALWQKITAVLLALGLNPVEIYRLEAERWGKEDYYDVEHDWADFVSSIEMTASAPSPLASSVEKTNQAKLSILVIDGGTMALRKIFDRILSPEYLSDKLYANYHTLKNLFRINVISKHQWDLLFPPGGTTPDSKTFDITLLFFLLTKFCGLRPPSSDWHNMPDPMDTSQGANLVRVRFFRNTLYGHASPSGVDTPTFNALWQEISAVLVALGLDQAEIDRLKAERWGKEDYRDVEHDMVVSVTSTDMAAAAPSPLAISEEKTNGAKLRRLLIDGGTTVLRNVFDRYHPPANLAAGLYLNYATLDSLLQREVLRKPRWDLLFPPGGATPDSKTFDIYLLFHLLTNICRLSPPPSGWHNMPDPMDTSLKANLVRVKFFRNKLYAHVPTTGVDTPTFNALWQEVSAVLVALGLNQVEIDRLKAERWGNEDYRSVQHDLADSPEDIKTQLRIHTHPYRAKSVTSVRQTQLEVRETLQDRKLKVDEVLHAKTKTQSKLQELHQTQTKTQQVIQGEMKTQEELDKLEFIRDTDYHVARYQQGTHEWVFNEAENWLDDRSLAEFGYAEELSDKDDDNSEKDVDDHDNGSDNYDDDRTDGIKDITKQLLQFGIKEQEMEEPENPYEQEPDKIKIHE